MPVIALYTFQFTLKDPAIRISTRQTSIAQTIVINQKGSEGATEAITVRVIVLAITIY